MANDTNNAPAVDFSAGLVPKSSTHPSDTTGAIDFFAGLVPKDSIQQSQPPTKPGLLDKANEYAGKALSAAGLPTSISNIPEWFQHLTGTHPNSEPFWEPVKRAIQNPTQENIVGAVPFVGPASVSMSKDVQKGDYAGAVSTL